MSAADIDRACRMANGAPAGAMNRGHRAPEQLWDVTVRRIGGAPMLVIENLTRARATAEAARLIERTDVESVAVTEGSER